MRPRFTYRTPYYYLSYLGPCSAHEHLNGLNHLDSSVRLYYAQQPSVIPASLFCKLLRTSTPAVQLCLLQKPYAFITQRIYNELLLLGYPSIKSVLKEKGPLLLSKKDVLLLQMKTYFTSGLKQTPKTL